MKDLTSFCSAREITSWLRKKPEQRDVARGRVWGMLAIALSPATILVVVVSPIVIPVMILVFLFAGLAAFNGNVLLPTVALVTVTALLVIQALPISFADAAIFFQSGIGKRLALLYLFPLSGIASALFRKYWMK